MFVTIESSDRFAIAGLKHWPVSCYGNLVPFVTGPPDREEQIEWMMT